MILGCLSYEYTIGRLVNSQTLMDNTFKIYHIFNFLISYILVRMNIFLYFCFKFGSDFRIHYNIVHDHHSRMWSSVCACNVKGTEIIHYFCDKLRSSLSFSDWLIDFMDIILFYWFSLFYLINSVLYEVCCELFVLVYLVGY